MSRPFVIRIAVDRDDYERIFDILADMELLNDDGIFVSARFEDEEEPENLDPVQAEMMAEEFDSYYYSVQDGRLKRQLHSSMPHCCDHEHHCDEDARHFHACCGHWHGVGA